MHGRGEGPIPAYKGHVAFGRYVLVYHKKKITYTMKMVTYVLLLVAIALALLLSICQAGVESFGDQPAPAGAD